MKENKFKWMVYALLFLILYYVSKHTVYIWLSGISGFMYGIGVVAAFIELFRNKYRKEKYK